MSVEDLTPPVHYLSKEVCYDLLTIQSESGRTTPPNALVAAGLVHDETVSSLLPFAWICLCVSSNDLAMW